MVTRQQKYESRRREAGNTTVSARLTAEQASVIKTAGGPTNVLRFVADAILAGGEIKIVSGEGTIGTIEAYDGTRTLPAIRRRLQKERVGGERWARAEVFSHESDTGPVSIDVETGDYR